MLFNTFSSTGNNISDSYFYVAVGIIFVVIVGLVNEIRKNWREKIPDKIKTVSETVEDNGKYNIYLDI